MTVLPQSVIQIINRLEQRGFSAYAVGGCVRDSLLSNIPSDWDIATNALPNEIQACFSGEKIIPTGLRHGTLTLILEGLPYEITTFRVDGQYSDHRRPESVRFTSSLHEDLSRRDFTINAIAYNPREGLIDYFDGKRDLNAKIIRCVGAARERFNEDALRIMRCARFAAALDFEIEPETRGAMIDLCPLLDSISAERKRDELCKAIMGKAFTRVFLENAVVLTQVIPEAGSMRGFDQRTPYHCFDILEHTLRAVSYAPHDLNIRLAMLFHDIGKPNCFTVDEKGIGHFKGHQRVSAEICESAMTRLRFDNDTIRRVVRLVTWHDAKIEPAAKSVRRWLNRMGEEEFRKLLEVQKADNKAKAPDHIDRQIKAVAEVQTVLEEVVRERQCFCLRDLAVNGNDLTEFGMEPGKELGAMLDTLMNMVIDGDADNDMEILLAIAKRKMLCKE